jgi:glycosyltransferase involved in cell wall biosynthesis
MTTTPGAPTTSGKRIAYVMSRFPKITETFILYEILELERQGMQVEVFPLIREQTQTIHAEAQAIVERAHYTKLLSREVLDAQFYWLLRRPRAYVRAWRDAIRGNRESPKFLSRAIVVVPQAALFARRMVELDVAHLHAHYATHPALAAYVVRLLAGIPYSFTAHAHDIYVERPMLAEKVEAASFIVAISEYNRALLGRLYGAAAREKAVVIHCGVDPHVFRPRAERVRREEMTIVCVASLEEYKGHPFLIDACAHLRDAGVPFRCLLVGDGEDRPAIEAQVTRLELGEQITLLGRRPRDEVSRLVADADVMVLPSIITQAGKMEGIPVALMEALATELPVVATAISGVPELIEDGVTGLLAPERDSRALAAALQRLWNDPEAGRRMAAAGRERVLREFNLIENSAALMRLLARDWRDAAQPAAAGGIAPAQR